MIELNILIAIFFTHWVADFICQNDYMALGKSKGMGPLSLHILVYSLILLFLMAPIVANYTENTVGSLLIWVILNGLIHGFVDFFTSRLNSRYYARGDMSSFWNMIGFDQFIHAATLMATYVWIFK